MDWVGHPLCKHSLFAFVVSQKNHTHPLPPSIGMAGKFLLHNPAREVRCYSWYCIILVKITNHWFFQFLSITFSARGKKPIRTQPPPNWHFSKPLLIPKRPSASLAKTSTRKFEMEPTKRRQTETPFWLTCWACEPLRDFHLNSSLVYASFTRFNAARIFIFLYCIKFIMIQLLLEQQEKKLLSSGIISSLSIILTLYLSSSNMSFFN